MNFYRNFSKALALTLALAFFGAAAFAQTQIPSPDDEILVAGNPALRQSDVFVLIEFYEWVLERKFTAAERREFQTLIVAEARAKPAALQTYAEIKQGFGKIRAVDEEQRRRIHAEFAPPLIAEMKANRSEPFNRLLLGGNAGAGDRTPDDSAGDAALSPSGLKAADLAGTWTTGGVSGERYKSLISGELSDPSGTLIEYEISPNGQVKYAGYTSNTFYSCTVQMFVYKTGRVSVDGANLVFDYAAGSRTNIPCAAAKREATIPAERKTVPFRIERDRYGVKLCLAENGAELCLRKAGE